jgi:ComF family protein
MSLQHGSLGMIWEPWAVNSRALGSGVLDLILPHRSLDGGRAVQSQGLSVDAWNRIVFVEAPVCDGCGSPFEHDLGAGVRCPSCLARSRVFSRARAACLYDESSRDMILPLKHADRTELAPVLCSWLGRAAADLLDDADAVTPVPLHPWRLLRRRYNQAAEIARPLARQWRRAYLPGVLRRLKADSQAGRSAAGRRRTAAGAFVVPDAKRRQVEGKRILLIDDVMTTGATAEACARALLRAGARAVDVAVIAKVRDVSPRVS